MPWVLLGRRRRRGRSSLLFPNTSIALCKWNLLSKNYLKVMIFDLRLFLKFSVTLSFFLIWLLTFTVAPIAIIYSSPSSHHHHHITIIIIIIIIIAQASSSSLAAAAAGKRRQKQHYCHRHHYANAINHLLYLIFDCFGFGSFGSG